MKRKKITQSIYRILYSDVLPYELPLFISNDGYYQMADRLRLSFSEGKIVSRKENLNTKRRQWKDAWITLLNGTGNKKKSFNYFINKGDNVRELVFIHPFMQLKVLDFYRTYEGLILNFCRNSSFSLRYPDKRASFVRPHGELPKVVEKLIDYKANEIPKHYFHYHRYDNINAFYQGKEFQRLESRFEKLFQTDIKHCFDTIPIERLAEALYQSEKSVGSDNFPAKFTLLMQALSEGRKPFYEYIHNPTEIKQCRKGVVIGPEFSRLFAEMFLQRLDKDIEHAMTKSNTPYRLHDDYECLRYVDDIFLFYKDDKVKDRFVEVLKNVLDSFGMEMNEKKNKDYVYPMVDGVGKAKRAMILVVERMFEDRLKTTVGLARRHEGKYDFPYKIKSQYCIMDIKNIVSNDGLKIGDVSASMLAHLHRKIGEALDKLDDLFNEYYRAAEQNVLDRTGERILRKYEKGLVIFVTELTKVLFFIFSRDMRMSTSIRVLSILSIIVEFFCGTLFANKHTEVGRDVNMNYLSISAKNKMFKTIIDELNFILKHNKLNATNGLEISNILLILTLIPRQYHISSTVLEDFLDGKFEHCEEAGEENVLMALTLLYVLCKNGVKTHLTDCICQWLLQDCQRHNWSMDDAESLLIITILFVFPNVPDSYKKELLENLDEPFRSAVQRLAIGRSPFIQWHRFNLAKACQMKFSAAVY